MAIYSGACLIWEELWNTRSGLTLICKDLKIISSRAGLWEPDHK